MTETLPVVRKSSGWGALLAFLLLTLAVGAVAGIATAKGVNGWYATLEKPSFNPPNGVFAPVWTTLYVLMAIAAWRVWRLRGIASVALILFFVQLALNFAWSFIFFTAHDIRVALMEIAVLWLAIVLTTIAFFRADRIAGWLMVPYIAWVSFASLLNYSVYQLNG